MERTASCPSCHRGVFADDAFCSGCGTPLRAPDSHTGTSRRSLAARTVPTGERSACGSCNSALLPGTVFCSTCGARTEAGTEPAEDGSDRIPRRVAAASGGKYEFVGILGRGGMGMVFTARDVELERLVAIKVLSPAWLSDSTMVERFQREARTIASLRHESIVSVYEVGRADELYYFVMDFIEGVPLSRVLRRYGPLPIPVVEAVFYQVASALAYAHRPDRKIVHRDVKPSNIMLDGEGRATLMDFGISKVTEAPSGLTRTGLVIGTPEYMSPEQCRGHTVTIESDQYSLGTVLYTMLTGAPPFTGPFYRVLMAHQNEAVPPLLEVRPDCPPKLAAATERMLAKVPGERWPGIRDVLRDLGLHPLAPDDPILQGIGQMVRETTAAQREGEADSTAGSDARERTATSIRVEPVPADLEVGDALRLNATVLFDDGGELADPDVSWQSTDPSIVRVDASTGELVAVDAGHAHLTAVGAGISESVAVEVRPPRVTRVELEPREISLEVGESVQLRARPLSKHDRPLERALTWSSSDPRALKVTPDGTATAQREGVVSVLVHCDGVGAAAPVRVVAPPESSPGRAQPGMARPPHNTGPPPRDMAVPPHDTHLPPRDAAPTPHDTDPPRHDTAAQHTVPQKTGGVRRTPSAAPAGTGSPPGGKELFRSILSPLGRRWVPLLSVPTLLVVALGFWMFRGTSEPAPAAAELSLLDAAGLPLDDGLQLSVGDTVALAVLFLDEEGRELPEGPPLEWSSSDPAIARIDGTGSVVALAEGSARILAASGDLERTAPVTVRGRVREVLVHRPGDPSSTVERVEVQVGTSTELAATVLEEETPVAEAVEWTSSAPAVATVDGSGRVTGEGAGEAEITAAGRGGMARVAVRVTRAPDPDPPPPNLGTLEISVRPWAHIFVDGVRRSDERVPGLELSLPEGTHRIRLESPGRLPHDTTVTVRAGEQTTIQKFLSGGDQ